MIVTCWSVKGGSGTTVVASCLAVVASRARKASLIVDSAGDVPAALGLDQTAEVGLFDWLEQATTVVGAGGAAWTSVPVGGPRVAAGGGDLGDYETRVDDELSVLARGTSDATPVSAAAADLLARRLAGDGRFVVVDAGTVAPGESSPLTERLVASADRSLVVLRPCYLALRHLTSCARRVDGVVLIEEPGRSLGADDVAAVAGVPVVARLRFEPQVARIVDAGLLCSRVPRTVERALADLVEG